MTERLLEVDGLEKEFPVGSAMFGFRPRSWLKAVSGVSFSIRKSETLALVGESGCGKSTVGRCILRLMSPTSGRVTLDYQRIDTLKRAELRQLRKKVQIVFQDPFSSMNPRQNVGDAIQEPMQNFALATSRGEREAKTLELLRLVGLPDDAKDRWPHEFSGGQRQRIGIARALAVDPQLIVLDEAVSALDLSVKAQIVNLLKDLQAKTGVAFLFISHDLAIVENIAHRVAVMYLGQIVEIAPRDAMYLRPRHPYSRALLSSNPVRDPSRKRAREILQGDIPSPMSPPTGCRFHTRCKYAHDRCRIEQPILKDFGGEHSAACHLNDLPASENPMLQEFEI
jgi:peptide/nickel transport system ATP-binding protein